MSLYVLYDGRATPDGPGGAAQMNVFECASDAGAELVAHAENEGEEWVMFSYRADGKVADDERYVCASFAPLEGEIRA